MPGVYEGVQLMLVAIIYLGLSRSQAYKTHITVEALVNQFPVKWRSRIEMASLFLCLATFVAITYVTGRAALFALVTNDTSMGLIRFPLWPSKAFVPLGSALICVRFMTQIVDLLSHNIEK
ncbi:TRAP transporter small permease [Chloroflexota bacterium]